MSFNANAERVRARLFRRREAYRAVFLRRGSEDNDAPWWARLWRAWTGGNAELGPQAEIVMADLARYCHARHSSLRPNGSGHGDAILLAFAEGQRDVFNRICAQLNLTSDQISRIAASKEYDT